MRNYFVVIFLAFAIFAIANAMPRSEVAVEDEFYPDTEIGYYKFNVKDKFNKLKEKFKVFKEKLLTGTTEKIDKIKTGSKSVFKDAKKQLVSAKDKIKSKSKNLKADIKEKMIAAEKSLRNAEAKLDKVSNDVESKLQEYLEKSKKYLYEKADVYKKAADEMESSLKGNDKCTEKYGEKVTKFYEDVISGLNTCVEKELKFMESVASGIKTVLIDLPTKCVRTTGDIVACINRPGTKCLKPVSDLIFVAGKLFSTLVSIEESLRTGSFIKPLETAKCAFDNHNQFKDNTDKLRKEISLCLKS